MVLLQDAPTHRSHSEGEFIAPSDLDYEFMQAVTSHAHPADAPHAATAPRQLMRTQKSLGEITLESAMQAQQFAYQPSAPKRKSKKTHDLVSPGDVTNIRCHPVNIFLVYMCSLLSCRRVSRPATSS